MASWIVRCRYEGTVDISDWFQRESVAAISWDTGATYSLNQSLLNYPSPEALSGALRDAYPMCPEAWTVPFAYRVCPMVASPLEDCWGGRETGMTPKPLIVDYNPDVDILTLWNGTPASNASDIGKGVLVFFDEEDEPQMVTIEDARELLMPYLLRG